MKILLQMTKAGIPQGTLQLEDVLRSKNLAEDYANARNV